MPTESTRSGSDEFVPDGDLLLPESLRIELSKQYTAILDQSELPELARRYTLVAVGDVVCHTMLSSGIVPKIMVFDLRTRRGGIQAEWADELMAVHGIHVKVSSPAAVLSRELWDALAAAWKEEGVTKIEVSGEEDLAGLASIYMMEGAMVIYGLPGRGMTGIVSGKETRAVALHILERMVPV